MTRWRRSVTLGAMTWWRNLSKEWKGGIATIAAVVAFTAFCIGADIWEDRQQPREPGGFDAQVACEDFVKARLKSPSSAKFSSVTRAGANPTWTITGDVDAENTFGASLRSRFTCVVELAGGRWHLRSLTGLAQRRLDHLPGDVPVRLTPVLVRVIPGLRRLLELPQDPRRGLDLMPVYLHDAPGTIGGCTGAGRLSLAAQ